MIVRLTDAQLDRCRHYASPAHDEWLDTTPLRVGRATLEVLMPPIGWKTLLAQLSEHAYNHLGQRRPRVAQSTQRAVQHIGRALVEIEAHCAFGPPLLALQGLHSHRFLAWAPEVEGWSPYPVRDGHAVVRVPEWFRVGGLDVTRWLSRPPSLEDPPILQPAEHERFMTHA